MASTKDFYENIKVYVRCRPMNSQCKRSAEIVDVISSEEILVRHTKESKKFTFDRIFGQDSKQVDVYKSVVAPLIKEVLSGYNGTVFAYGQTGTGKTHTMVGTERAESNSSWKDNSDIGIIPRALCHLLDELRMRKLEFAMRISYIELYNEELRDLLSSDNSTKIRIYEDKTKTGSVIIQGLEEKQVHNKDDVYKLLEEGKQRRKIANTLMNKQSSRSHTMFSILVHIKENGNDDEMLKIGKLNLVDLAGSENVSKAGNVKETVNINKSLLALGRVITSLIEKAPHVPYRESKLTRLLQDSLGGRTKTSIIATISPSQKDIEETLSTVEYALRAKNIQYEPKVNQKLTKKTVLKECTKAIDHLKSDLMAALKRCSFYLAEKDYNEITMKIDSEIKSLEHQMLSKERLFNEVSLNLEEANEKLSESELNLKKTTGTLLKTENLLTGTQRRYKEKKVLLQSYVKTEETLKHQATQIMMAAEIATQDTEALHGTIERRKDVDVEIQRACERFSERMNANFKSMDETYQKLQTKLQYGHQFIQTELEQLENHFESMDENCKQLQTQRQYLKEILDAVIELMDELDEKDNHFKQQIKEKSTSLESFNEQQQLITNHRELQQQTNENRQGFDSIKQTSLDNIKDLKQKELEEEQSYIDKEKEFEQKMPLLENKCAKVKNIDSSQLALIGKATDTSLSIQQFENKTTNIGSKSHCNMSKNPTLDMGLGIDQTVAKCSTLNKELDNMSSECLKQSHQISETQSQYHKSFNLIKSQLYYIDKKLKNTSSSLEEIVKGFKISMQEKHKNASSSSEGETKSLRKHLDLIKSFQVSMQDSLKEFTRMYEEQMKTCRYDVDSFRSSELKTYTATGSTPSKREFSYPRVLATTSPQTKIFERFQQKNRWSDLDITAPIDEESESGVN